MIASYLRESTDRQDIETQRTLIREHCAKNNIVFQEFADDGVSGTVPFNKRPQSGKLLEAAKLGKVQEVIVYRFDRLGRDHADTYMAIGELLKRGVKVNSLKEGVAENTASGRLKTGIHTLFSAYERDSIVERSVDASRRLAAEGTWMGGIVPYGFRKSGEGKQARLALATEPIPGCKLSEAGVVQRIFRDAAEGKSSVWIANTLNRAGVPTMYAHDGRSVPQGKRSTTGIWWPPRVRNLITSKTYMGVHEWGKRAIARDDDGGKSLQASPPERWITRPCPAIVDADLWQRANVALHRNQIAAMAHPTHNYLLRGLVHCTCGLVYYGMAAKRPSGGENTYYMHSRGSARARCTTTALRGADLEAAIWADVEIFLAKPGKLIRQLEQQMTSEDRKGRKVADDIAELEPRIKLLDSARAMALRQLTRGQITESQFDKEVESIDREKTQVEGRLAELRETSADAKSQAFALGQARSALEKLRDKAFPDGTGKASVLPFEQRRALVVALVAGVTVTTPVEGKQPIVRVCYSFEPHAERFVEGARNPGLTPFYMGRGLTLKFGGAG
jgi:site-specific DNA recombinase